MTKHAPWQVCKSVDGTSSKLLLLSFISHNMVDDEMLSDYDSLWATYWTKGTLHGTDMSYSYHYHIIEVHKYIEVLCILLTLYIKLPWVFVFGWVVCNAAGLAHLWFEITNKSQRSNFIKLDIGRHGVDCLRCITLRSLHTCYHDVKIKFITIRH